MLAPALETIIKEKIRTRPDVKLEVCIVIVSSWKCEMDSIIEVCFSQVTKATVSSVKNEWASIASNSKEIHALKAEIKEEMKREVLDSKSKIVDELKGSLRGDLTQIVKKDVA